MHADAITGVGVELQLRRPLQQSQAREEIGAFFGGDGIALALDAFIDLTQHQIPPLGKTGDGRYFGDAIQLVRCHEHAGVTWVRREDGHPPTQRG